MDEVHNLLLISQLLYIPSLRGSLWLRKSSVGGANTGDIRAYARIVVLSHDFYAPESPVLSPQSLYKHVSSSVKILLIIFTYILFV